MEERRAGSVQRPGTKQRVTVHLVLIPSAARQRLTRMLAQVISVGGSPPPPARLGPRFGHQAGADQLERLDLPGAGACRRLLLRQQRQVQPALDQQRFLTLPALEDELVFVRRQLTIPVPAEQPHPRLRRLDRLQPPAAVADQVAEVLDRILAEVLLLGVVGGQKSLSTLMRSALEETCPAVLAFSMSCQESSRGLARGPAARPSRAAWVARRMIQRRGEPSCRPDPDRRRKRVDPPLGFRRRPNQRASK